MMVCLRMLDASGQPTGSTFEFESHETFLFGRDVNAHCRITNDPAVSRHHFMLEIIPPDIRVKDLGSTNGVYINGELYGGKNGKRQPDGSVPVVALKHGDRLRIGKTQIEVQLRVPPTEAATFALPVADGTPPSATDIEGDVDRVLDLFCDHCGKIVARHSAVMVHGRTLCMACRLVHDVGLGGGAGGSPWSDDAPPHIAGFELVRKVGKGGMGVVYKARRLADDATVAVKVLLPEVTVKPDNEIMFRREIAISRSLAHEGIVRFHEGGSVGGVLFLVMEYLSGGSLWRRIAKKIPVPLPVALRWMRETTAGLAAAHSRQLVHRDLKPANILLDAPGERARAKIADFGLAKSLRSAGLSGFTATGMTAGTTTCMPPEQLADFKRVSAAADVFSLGATFYELLAGCSPYNFQKGKEPVATVLAFDVTPLAKRCPEMPPSLARFIDRCIANDPKVRFADAAAMLAALDKIRIDGA